MMYKIASMMFMCMIVGGIIMIFHRNFMVAGTIIRVKMKENGKRRRNGKIHGLTQEINNMLDLVSGGRISSRKFATCAAIASLVMFSLALQTLDVKAALLIGVFTISIPYMGVFFKFMLMRKHAGMEGEIFVAGFLSAYRICNGNIYRTLEYIAEEKSEAKRSKALITRTLLELRTVGDKEVMKEILNRFAYAVNTNWSRMLAYNLYIAADSGKNVAMAIEDILLQLREASALSEERKRLNNEANRMVVFLIPLLYAATILLAVKYMDIPIAKFVRNQFFTSEGFLFFSVSCFMFVCNLLVLELVSSRNLDY